jgi:hypothetical protein
VGEKFSSTRFKGESCFAVQLNSVSTAKADSLFRRDTARSCSCGALADW